jgi:hypothetical protein
MYVVPKISVGSDWGIEGKYDDTNNRQLKAHKRQCEFGSWAPSGARASSHWSFLYISILGVLIEGLHQQVEKNDYMQTH